MMGRHFEVLCMQTNMGEERQLILIEVVDLDPGQWLLHIGRWRGTLKAVSVLYPNVAASGCT